MNDRGTASVEIVVMLPVFILLLACVYYLLDQGQAKAEASSTARRCAWSYAVSGCQQKPPGCDGASMREEGAEDDPEAQDTQGEQREGTMDKIAGIPVVGPIVQGMVGEGFRVTATAEARAAVTADEKAAVRSDYYLLCNTVSQGWGDMIKRMFSGAQAGESWGATE